MTVTATRFLIRPMTIADIPRVSEIERESFPTMWPQTAYKRELQQNKLSAYLVLCRLPDEPNPTTPARMRSDEAGSRASGVRGVLRRLGSLLSERAEEDLAPGVDI